MPDGKYDVVDIWYNIVSGYSKYPSSRGDVIFKHLSSYESYLFSQQYKRDIELIARSGLGSSDEQLKLAYESGIWTLFKEERLEFLQKTLRRLYATQKKLFYDHDKKNIKEQIAETLTELQSLNQEKRSIIPISAEDIASQKSIDFFLKNFIFTDAEFKIRLFQDDLDFEYCDELFIEELTIFYFEYLKATEEQAIKVVAISALAQNAIHLCDGNTYHIFDKPIHSLTKLQYDLLLYCKKYYNMIKNCNIDIPDGVLGDPDKFEEWFAKAVLNSQKKAAKPSKGNVRGSTFVFGDKQEAEALGGSLTDGNAMIRKAQNSGGLGINELMT